MKLKDDYLVSINNFSYSTHEFISIITNKGTGKRVRLTEFELSTRTRRGIQVLREVKSNPYYVVKTFIEDSKKHIGLKNGTIDIIKLTELPIADRYSTGSQIIKKNITTAYVVPSLEKAEKVQESLIEEPEIIEVIDEKPIKKERVSLQEIDDRLMTIDDFLNEKEE